MGFSGGGAEMVEMSIRTRDPKKSTRVPPSEEGEETRRGFKRGGGEARALTSRAILPCRDRGGWATACSRRTPWGCSCHGPGRPPPAGRPYRSCARRCGCRKPSLSSLQVKTPSYRFREEFVRVPRLSRRTVTSSDACQTAGGARVLCGPCVRSAGGNVDFAASYPFLPVWDDFLD